MSRLAIKIENLSKAYQIGQIGTGTISRDIERWWTTKVMGKEDPFLKIGETNDRSKRGKSNVVWSLKDINLEIEQGDAFGIIGKNGAGKSTLLKLLSRVTSPTTGKIGIKGRVASLLEVGTGFHPELTGRENVYLNGSILGMRKKEIDRKFDEIVDFSGIERYIDTPVKRYSSGMYVRLAFAVAAHLESEILIVDEVLAVGDAKFQEKCLGKLSDVSNKDERTVLFVSHNLAAVNDLCDKGMLLIDGENDFIGEASETIRRYRQSNVLSGLNFPLELDLFTILSFRHEQVNHTHVLDFKFSSMTEANSEVFVKISVKTLNDEIVYETSQEIKPNKSTKTMNLRYQCEFDFLQNGEYIVFLSVFEHKVRWLIRDQFLLKIGKYEPRDSTVDHFGLIEPVGTWTIAH